MNRVARQILFIFSSAAVGTALAADPAPVKLGVAGPLTGPQAQYGRDFQSGVELAVDDFNATRPKLDGKDVKFVLVSVDDQADPKTGTLVAQKLVDDGIRGMLGHFNSGTSIPASAIYSKAGIAQLTTATAPAYTRQGFKTTFRMMTSDTQQGKVMGEYVVKELKAGRIAIVDDRTAYGQGLADEFEKAAKAAGGQIVAREFTTDKAFDFRPILTILKGKKPDLIYYAGTHAQSAPMVQQLRSLGMKTQFASGEMSKTEEFLKLAGTASNGTIVSLAGLPLENMPGGADFAKRYKAKFNAEPTTYAPYSYDGTMALMKAMTTAGTSDPAKYLPILAKSDIKGVTTNHLAYDTYGDLREATITVYQADNGKWKPIKTLGGK
ncbi:branched-chain amino acid ABC transporter substrate-binding protein [Cupriavidus necator]